jgi:hypothetical protein
VSIVSVALEATSPMTVRTATAPAMARVTRHAVDRIFFGWKFGG